MAKDYLTGQKKANNLAKKAWEDHKIHFEWLHSEHRHDGLLEYHGVHTYRIKKLDMYDTSSKPIPLTVTEWHFLNQTALKKGFIPILDSQALDVFTDGEGDGGYHRLGENEWYLILISKSLFTRVIDVLEAGLQFKVETSSYLQEEQSSLSNATQYGNAVNSLHNFLNSYTTNLDIEVLIDKGAHGFDKTCTEVQESFQVLKKDEEVCEFLRSDMDVIKDGYLVDNSAFYHITRPRAVYTR